MYEKVTYEVILQRMLDTVPNTMDKREGAIIYNALAPAAIELQNMYIAMDSYLNESFADTQSRDYLIRRAAERGITPVLATKAVLKGEFNKEVPIGARFSLDELSYVVTEKISINAFKLECQTAGAIGNQKLGTIIPVDYINGLTMAELTEILIHGEDEEETEALRQRYFDSLESQAFGGNVTDYKEKTLAIAGVGGVKVYPTWQGGGTVKLIIMDAMQSVPSSTLIESVQKEVDPVAHAGQGKGFAPIGHVVTVEGVTAMTIDVATTITYQEGWSWEDVEPYVRTAIDNYFEELATGWADETNLIVRISQIETRLLNLQGIVDVSETVINGLPQNLVIGADSVPVRGDISG